MQSLTPFPEVIDLIKEEGGDPLKLCYQCGTCTATCPWNLVKNFIVRRVMHQGQMGLIDFENEEVWMCATCKACVDRCPRGVAIIDVMRSLRRAIVEKSLAEAGGQSQEHIPGWKRRLARWREVSAGSATSCPDKLKLLAMPVSLLHSSSAFEQA